MCCCGSITHVSSRLREVRGMQGDVSNQVLESLVGRVRMGGKIGVDGFLHGKKMAGTAAEKVALLKFGYWLTVSRQLLENEPLICSKTCEVGCGVQLVCKLGVQRFVIFRCECTVLCP